MANEQRVEALEAVAVSVRKYLDTMRDFYVREEEAGRIHVISVRVKMAHDEVVRNLLTLEGGVLDA